MQRHFLKKISAPLLLASITVFYTQAQAEIIEESLHIPVTISYKNSVIKQTVFTTVVRDNQLKHQQPVVLIAHGRPTTVEDRERVGQVKYPGNALWLAQQGFVVVVPTRIGYGITGGVDVDYSGECNNKSTLHALPFGAQQYQQIIRIIQKSAYVNRHKTVLIGESFGAMIALDMANLESKADAKNKLGIIGVVNMSGGDGGDYSHLEQPCEPQKLEQSFAQLGKNNLIQTRWMYSQNDRFWGATYPKLWFDAYIKSGGRGDFIALPADKNNGHFIFNRNVLAWHPAMLDFFKKIGLDEQK